MDHRLEEMEKTALNPGALVEKWCEEVRGVITIVTGLVEENARLKVTAAATEQKCERLGREMSELIAQKHSLERACEELGETVNRIANEMLHLLNAMVEKVRMSEKKADREREVKDGPSWPEKVAAEAAVSRSPRWPQWPSTRPVDSPDALAAQG